MARRAVNLHGCAPASLCPPFFLLRGYPRERISYGSGAPPLLRRLRRTLLLRLPCCLPDTLPYLRNGALYAGQLFSLTETVREIPCFSIVIP